MADAEKKKAEALKKAEEEKRVAALEKDRRERSRKAGPPTLKIDDVASKRIADKALESMETGEKHMLRKS